MLVYNYVGSSFWAEKGKPDEAVLVEGTGEMAQLRVHTALAEDWCLAPRPVGSLWVSARTCPYAHIHTEGCGQWYPAAFTHRRGLALLTGCRCEKSRSRLGTAGSALRRLARGRAGCAEGGAGARGRTSARSRPLAGSGAAAAPLPGRAGGQASGGGLDGLPTERVGRALEPHACRLPCPLARGARHGRLARLGQRQPAEVQ